MTEAIPKGYKQTEIGIIPEDWDLPTLDEKGIFKKGKGIRKDEVLKSGLPCIRYGEIYTKHNDYIKKINSFISKSVAEESQIIKKGDLLFAGSGETKEEIGKCVAYLDNEDAFAGGDIIIFTPSEGDSKYLGFLMNHSLIIKQKSKVAQGDAIVHIYSSSLKKILIPFPDPKEQSAIAQVLSETDELIQQLDKLITKKKNIKKGVMQKLLTGKKRLRGFSGEWKINLFSNLVNINKGEQINKSELTETGEYPDWNGGIEPSGYTNKWNMMENTITISEGGNSCGFVNYCKQKFWLGGHCYALEIINKTDKIFLYHLLKFKQNSIMALRIGSGLPNIQKKNLNQFELFIPKDKQEQQAIANVLSDIDADIEELKRKRDKYNMIKEGMMQQLLTGRIRLKC